MKRRTVKLKLKDIQIHSAGDMLVQGDTMKPYLDHYAALMTRQDSNLSGNKVVKTLVDGYDPITGTS
jgi:hypothetical protein